MRSSSRRAAARYAFSASTVHVSANKRQSAACRRVAQDARSYIRTWKILAYSRKERNHRLLEFSRVLGGNAEAVTTRVKGQVLGVVAFASDFFLLTHTPPFPRHSHLQLPSTPLASSPSLVLSVLLKDSNLFFAITPAVSVQLIVTPEPARISLSGLIPLGSDS